MSEPVRGIELTIAYTLLTEGAAGKRVLTPQECADIADLMQRRQTEWHALKSATTPPASVVERDANRYREGEKLPTPEGCCENGERDARNDPQPGDVCDMGEDFGYLICTRRDGEDVYAMECKPWEGRLEVWAGGNRDHWLTREQWAARRKDGA